MRLTERMYRNAEPIWRRYLEHPFVREMASGTLPSEKFRYYMLQDYAYLRDYIKIFAASILKAENFGEIRFLCDNMTAVLEETFRVHVPYMRRLGITEEEIRKTEPSMENSSYTHYMICEAQTGDILAGLVALLNCSWTYAYIAENMVKEFPDAPNLADYGDWFAGYICPEYRETNQQLIDMVNRLSAGKTEQEQEKLCAIFKKCSLYEWEFWEMAYRMGDGPIF